MFYIAPFNILRSPVVAPVSIYVTEAKKVKCVLDLLKNEHYLRPDNKSETIIPACKNVAYFLNFLSLKHCGKKKVRDLALNHFQII